MTKNSIELTLQQLIDIGVIKLKNKKRRKNLKRAKVPKISNDIFSQNKAPSSHMQGYSTPNYLPMYTDALRLRDDNLNLNTRLLEQKQLLENSKQDADEFQNKTRAAFMHVFNNMTSAPTLGYSDYDADGAFGGNGGSDYFRSMNDIRPDTAVRMPDYIPPASGPVIDEIDDDRGEDIDSTLTFDRRDAFYNRQPQVEITPTKSSKGLLGSMGFKNPFKQRSMSAAKSAAAQINEDVFDEPWGTTPDAVQQEEIHTPQRLQTLPDVKAAGAGGGAAVELPEINSGDYYHVKKTKTKPTSEEVRQWKQFYESVAGDDVDPDVLATNRRTDIERAIVNILIPQYEKLGGNKKEILRSSDSTQISKEVEKLKRLKQILA